MRYCDTCLVRPAKKKASAIIARVLGSNPDERLCRECDAQLVRQAEQFEAVSA
jgi:hypothetical protein